MSRAAVLFAQGLEECEGLIVVDLLRRAKIETDIVSLDEREEIISSHNVSIRADCSFDHTDFVREECLGPGIFSRIPVFCPLFLIFIRRESWLPRSVLLLLCWKLPEYSPEKRPRYIINLRKNLFPRNMSVKKWFQTEISLLPGDLVLRFRLACPLWKDAAAYMNRNEFAKQ